MTLSGQALVGWEPAQQLSPLCSTASRTIWQMLSLALDPGVTALIHVSTNQSSPPSLISMHAHCHSNTPLQLNLLQINIT